MDASGMHTNCKLSAKFGGLAMAGFLQALMRSLDYKITHYDITTDPARPEFRGRFIYVFWHEYITFPVTLWGGYDVAALVSMHRDGEWITRASNHLGFEIVRGSTSRGGAKALRQLKRKSQSSNLTIMPDGPKGPRRKMAAGPIYLSSRLGVPLIPVGFGYDRPWRTPTWDRFAVPRPFSRARSIFGPPMAVPRRADRDQLEHYRLSAETLLNRLTLEAETWAESGKRKMNEYAIRRLRKKQFTLPLDRRHIDSATGPVLPITSPINPYSTETVGSRKAS